MLPGWGRPPGEGYGKPFHYSCLEKSMDRPWGRKESGMTMWLTLSVSLSYLFIFVYTLIDCCSQSYDCYLFFFNSYTLHQHPYVFKYFLMLVPDLLTLVINLPLLQYWIIILAVRVILLYVFLSLISTLSLSLKKFLNIICKAV